MNNDKKKKKAADPSPRVNPVSRPQDMTLEQWQVALRRQAARRETFDIAEYNAQDHPGYYTVENQTSHHQYRVVYRGRKSPWTFCSCPDFRTNQLGTCKHVEAVRLWIAHHHRGVRRQLPTYSSVYLSYQGQRTVRLRIGTHQGAAQLQQLAEPYFTPQGVLRPEAMATVSTFFTQAINACPQLRIYQDAVDYIVEQRDRERRLALMPTMATDQALATLLRTTLYPYQREGIRFAFRAGKCIIADEMGLGKTIQAIGAAELMRRHRLASTVLVVCPTSLKYQWKKEIERFTHASAIVVEGSHPKRVEMYGAEQVYKIVSYNSVANDIKILGQLYTDFLIMDEVQRLKNWNTHISRAARHIESTYTVVLSGTPLENKLEELYSVMQFVDQYCLGPLHRFMENTVVRSDTGQIISYRNLHAVGKQLAPVLLRRRKSQVALQLPPRVDKTLYVPLTPEQRSMHDEWQAQVAKLVHKWRVHHFLSEKERRRMLLHLSQMRMVADSTYVLDQHTRADTKVDEVMHILKQVAEEGHEKVVIFSQWERMTRLIAAQMDSQGIDYRHLHGGIPSKQRGTLVADFVHLPQVHVFLSTDAGATGLNLQAASIIINIDLPWNPAVLEQRIARIYRLGQQRHIQVINLVASNSIEERMLGTLNVKSALFQGILDDGQDVVFMTQNRLEDVMKQVQTLVDTTPTTQGTTLTDTEPEAEPEEKTITPQKAQMPGSPTAPIQEKEPTTPPPHELIAQGATLLGHLARTLATPQGAQQLADQLVHRDKATGQTTLRIPVPDKDTVSQMLSLLGKILGNG